MEQPDMETTVESLEQDIERDREDLDHTLTELRERLTFEHLVAETRDHLAKALQSSAEIVRRHPVQAGAVALLAAGAVLGRSRARSRRQARWMQSLGLRAALEDLARRGATAANGSAHDVLNAASQFLSGPVAERGREMAHETSDLLNEARHQLRDGGQRVQRRVESLAESQPGLVNALAMALGSAVMTALSRRH